jgi:hypothetical protein
MDGFGGKSIVYRVKRSIKMYSTLNMHHMEVLKDTKPVSFQRVISS